ncbi:MAG: class I SAM-dependent rRNA methyltransferase [Treponema sp.]|jgi:23S rRNA (cytosine1962-C5)-methyltransferase|nr:class I SAM-dependent rRNA methyltransferase [Treponema sp.]
MKRIILKPGEEKRILAGHPWVYDNEVECVLMGKGSPEGKAPGRAGSSVPSAELLPGECADVESAAGRGKPIYLGRAIVNPNSRIVARIYSPSKEGLDKGFFKRRIREALERRIPGAADVPVCAAVPAANAGPGFAGVPAASVPIAYNIVRESGRIVFGEADFLPGLIIDRFVGWPLAGLEAAERPLVFEAAEAALGPPRSWLSVQFLAYGMDCRRETILEALDEVLGAPLPGVLPAPPEGVIEKPVPRIREMEGLPPSEGLIRGTFPAGGIVIFENGLPFVVDLPEGQKTGHFLDQRFNRLLAGQYAAMLAENAGAANPPSAENAAALAPEAGRSAAADGSVRPALRVLDACSYTGGFGIHVLRAAPEAQVTAVDASAAALETLRKNAALNGAADRLTIREADVFDTLRTFERKKEKFDLVILDPPAFAKSRTVLAEALRGYREINLRAIKILRRGGILITCSCSHALDEARFKRILVEAAADAERRLVQLDFRYQPPDHPILLGYGESLYLKCGFYRVL